MHLRPIRTPRLQSGSELCLPSQMSGCLPDVTPGWGQAPGTRRGSVLTQSTQPQRERKHGVATMNQGVLPDGPCVLPPPVPPPPPSVLVTVTTSSIPFPTICSQSSSPCRRLREIRQGTVRWDPHLPTALPRSPLDMEWQTPLHGWRGSRGGLTPFPGVSWALSCWPNTVQLP